MLPLKLDSIFLVNFRYYLPIFQELCQTIFIRDIILFDVIRFDRNHKFIFFFPFSLNDSNDSKIRRKDRPSDELGTMRTRHRVTIN